MWRRMPSARSYWTVVRGRFQAAVALLVDLGARIRDVRMGPDGAVWVLTDHTDGRILRLVPG